MKSYFVRSKLPFTFCNLFKDRSGSGRNLVVHHLDILQLGDAAAALAAIIGLGAGVLAGRRRLSRPECLNQLVPVVEKKLHNAGH